MSIKSLAKILLFLPVCALAGPPSAQQALNNGRFDQAIRLWQQQLAREDNPLLHLRIAQAYVEPGLYDAAQAALEQARAGIDDDNPELWARWYLVDSQRLLAQNHWDAAQAQKPLESALALRGQIRDPLLVAEILNHAGNFHSSEMDYSAALTAYREALALTAQQAGAANLRAKVQLNHTHAQVMEQLFAAPIPASVADFSESLAALQRTAQILRDSDARYAQVFGYLQLHDLARQIHQRLDGPDAGLQHLLHTTVQQAVQIADALDHPHAYSHAHGTLSQWYLAQNQPDAALSEVRRALFFSAQSGDWNLPRWLRVQGQILRRQNQPQAALEAYRQAAEHLKPLRRKLANTGYRPPAGFREQIAPLYFELADLALQAAAASEPEARQALLREARRAVEDFKQAELQDYFRSQCITAQSNCPLLDEVLDDHTAALYPVMLADRLELLLSLPDGTMRQFRVPVSAEQLEVTAMLFVAPLRRHPHPDTRARGRPTAGDPQACAPGSHGRGKVAEYPEQAFRFLPHAKQLYNWLIQPLEAELQTHGIENLVIVPDGILRTVPFAALHNGDSYLIERYAVGISPGLCLAGGRHPRPADTEMLLGGISEAVQGFSALPCAEYELKTLHETYAPRQPLLLNQTFQIPELQDSIAGQPYSIVHIASHGEFKSKVDKSFILTYESRLTLDKLEQLNLLRRVTDQPIDLLTLSACETAKGNDRAALGLAGVALKAGAKSVLASLWQVDDNATPAVVIAFYRQLQNARQNKVQALRQAQMGLLQNEEYSRYRHPYYWAAFLMIGDWQ